MKILRGRLLKPWMLAALLSAAGFFGYSFSSEAAMQTADGEYYDEEVNLREGETYHFEDAPDVWYEVDPEKFVVLQGGLVFRRKMGVSGIVKVHIPSPGNPSSEKVFRVLLHTEFPKEELERQDEHPDTIPIGSTISFGTANGFRITEYDRGIFKQIGEATLRAIGVGDSRVLGWGTDAVEPYRKSFWMRVIPKKEDAESRQGTSMEQTSVVGNEEVLTLGTQWSISGTGGAKIISYDENLFQYTSSGGAEILKAIAPGRSRVVVRFGGMTQEYWLRVLPPEGYLDNNGRAVIPTEGDIAQYTTRVAELVNRERAKVGARPLRVAPDLMEAAAIRAEEISRYFSHTRPDGRECFTAVRHRGRTTGENIAAGNRTPEDVIKNWMNSPGHRANILRRDYAEIGVGYFSKADSEYGTYWVQIFRLR